MVLVNFNGVIAHFYDIIMPKRKPVEFLNLLKPFKRDDRVLEIGAGTGRMTKHYASFVNELYLLDPAPNMLKKAVQKIPHAKPVIGAAEEMDFESDFFTKIIGYDSFHHWSDQIKGLKETYRVLKPRGKLILMEVDTRKFWGQQVQRMEWILLRMNSKMYPPPILMQILEVVGFKDIKYDPTNHGLAYGLVCTKY